MLAKIDRIILYITLILILLGILSVYSSSYYISMRIYGDPYYFTKKQIFWAILSIIALFGFIYFDYKKLKNFIKPLMFITFLLLISVFIPGIGKQSGGAMRWLNFRIFTFNPSELAKMFVIIYLSYIFTKKQAKMENFTFGFLPPLLIVTSIFFIIVMQSGFSSAVLLLIVSFIMFFVGGASIKHIFSVIILSLPIIGGFIFQVAYRKARILSFINPWADPLGKGYHLIQSLRAFANGGLFGRGLGNSIQKVNNLPAAHTDFIISIIAEETGIIGITILFLLYILLFFRGFVIAKNCDDQFGQLLAFGITSLNIVHVVLNFGVVTGLLPPTGIPLPFVSFGGSSLLMLSISIGILLNISSTIENKNISLKEVDDLIQEGFN